MSKREAIGTAKSKAIAMKKQNGAIVTMKCEAIGMPKRDAI